MPQAEQRIESQPPSEEEFLQARAQQDVEWIRALMQLPAWEQYFKRRVVEKLGPLRVEILEKPLPLEEYREKQTKMNLLLELLKMPDEDLIANLAILGRQ